MYKIIISPRFKRSYKKIVRKKPYLQESIDSAIMLLAEDPFSHSLNTHKLSGEFREFLSSKCGYDCRIVFSIKKIKEIDSIILVDIGKHDDVY
jgi:mRNA interferase YafQ